jgi:hypothetical protein
LSPSALDTFLSSVKEVSGEKEKERANGQVSYSSQRRAPHAQFLRSLRHVCSLSGSISNFDRFLQRDVLPPLHPYYLPLESSILYVPPGVGSSTNGTKGATSTVFFRTGVLLRYSLSRTGRGSKIAENDRSALVILKYRAVLILILVTYCTVYFAFGLGPMMVPMCQATSHRDLYCTCVRSPVTVPASIPYLGVSTDSTTLLHFDTLDSPINSYSEPFSSPFPNTISSEQNHPQSSCPQPPALPTSS